jgi:enoyl-CoA hydratase/carnithine racemase
MAAPMNVAWLTAKFGEARAIELVVGGQPLTGRELYEKGIAAKVVPDELVLDEARAYADALARNNPAAMAQAKEVIRRMNGLSFPERLALAKAPVE